MADQCKELPEHGLCRVKAGRDSVRKAWFADSQFSNGLVHPDREAPAALRDRVHRIRADRANSVVVRIQQVLRVQADIRHAPEWAE
jgi:hypothetical protein